MRGNPMTCELCGNVDARGVLSGLACYADDGRFERMDRCTSHQECRGRVEEAGGVWPLADLTVSRKERTSAR